MHPCFFSLGAIHVLTRTCLERLHVRSWHARTHGKVRSECVHVHVWRDYIPRPLGKTTTTVEKGCPKRKYRDSWVLAPRAGLRVSFPTPLRSPRPRYAQVMARRRKYGWRNLLVLYNPSRLPRAHDEERGTWNVRFIYKIKMGPQRSAL
jgi:hypothetical protein